MTTKEQADQNLLFEDLKKSISDLSAHLWRIDELELDKQKIILNILKNVVGEFADFE